MKFTKDYMFDIFKKMDDKIVLPPFKVCSEYIDEVTGEKIELCKPKVIHILLGNNSDTFVSACKLVVMCVRIDGASLAIGDVLNLDMRQFVQIHVKLQEIMK
jgi:hypothetical protein